jgi:uncharacterized protein YceH (UPF0502 family)
VDADPVEIRVLGCLIEKQRTTPDVYPLSLNALRLACNQSTNRDPVVVYDEHQIRDALEQLGRRRWARLASAGGRTTKYRHLLDEALGLTDPQMAVLCVLMLRGPQTPGELKGRTERLHAFTSLAHLEQTLDELGERRLVVRLERRPGQKEQRFAHLLGPQAEPAAAPATAQAVYEHRDGSHDASALEERVARLEAEVEELRDELRALKGDLGA